MHTKTRKRGKKISALRNLVLVLFCFWFFFQVHKSSQCPGRLLQRPSQSLTGHLLSNTCSRAHHSLCQESSLQGLLPKSTGRSYSQKHSHELTYSEKSQQQCQWQEKADILIMAIWSNGTSRKDPLQKETSHFLSRPSEVLWWRRDTFSPQIWYKSNLVPPHKTYSDLEVRKLFHPMTHYNT